MKCWCNYLAINLLMCVSCTDVVQYQSSLVLHLTVRTQFQAPQRSVVKSSLSSYRAAASCVAISNTLSQKWLFICHLACTATSETECFHRKGSYKWFCTWASVNPLNPKLNPTCYLLALLGAHHFLHVSRIRVKFLTFRWLMSYIYGAPILDVSRSHTTTQHSR